MTCPDCGEPATVEHGRLVHTVAGRGDRWQGTLVELLTCSPARPHTETGD